MLKRGIVNRTNNPHNPQLLNHLGIQVRIVLLVKRMKVSLLWVYAEACFFLLAKFGQILTGKIRFQPKQMIFHGKTIPNSQPPKKNQIARFLG